MTNDLVEQNREIEIDKVLNQTGSEEQLQHQPFSRPELRGLMLGMPDGIRQMFGCAGCEWKGVKELCMLTDGLEKGEKVKKGDHLPIWICPRRASYLAKFAKDMYPDLVRHPNTNMWRKAILTATMHQQQMKDLFKYQQLETDEEIAKEKLQKFKDENPVPEKVIGFEFDQWKIRLELAEKEYNEISARSSAARARWMSTTNGLLFYNAKDLDRDTPKKLDIRTTNTLDLEQLDEIMQLGKNKLNKKENIIEGEIVQK